MNSLEGTLGVNFATVVGQVPFELKRIQRKDYNLPRNR